ncbi:ferric reductase [Streptacidiphilus sp. PB12-B1b]|uniref:ferric reductase-like transmembrane domain-containing protein n=1 Tax=Streptacidiphilus sp. PB12-B1b TaxID=2705012 RepID=UPI0015FBBB8E|nr:ferric reductase-like transmembrane domain-containing protein [Streptacidiphilus sp. PB12-B1b]QMU74721.1 ferric reductase [Streptacidiphilus sp. PB12-B1b]
MSTSTVIQLAAGPSPLWYTTRASGTVALVLLTATVVLGIAGGGQLAPKRIARFEVSTLHRNLSLLTLVFLALHITTAIADTFVSLTWWDAVVPFAASYRPLWVGLGALAFDLLLAVLLTSAVRLRLGVRRWKAVHWLAYAAWPLAVFHGAGTGTDTRLSLQLALNALCVAAVVVAVWWRLHRLGPEHRTAKLWAGAASVLVPVVLVVFLAAGPLKAGWAQRADGSRTPAAVSTATTDRTEAAS